MASLRPGAHSRSTGSGFGGPPDRIERAPARCLATLAFASSRLMRGREAAEALRRSIRSRSAFEGPITGGLDSLLTNLSFCQGSAAKSTFSAHPAGINRFNHRNRRVGPWHGLPAHAFGGHDADRQSEGSLKRLRSRPDDAWAGCPCHRLPFARRVVCHQGGATFLSPGKSGEPCHRWIRCANQTLGFPYERDEKHVPAGNRTQI